MKRWTYAPIIGILLSATACDPSVAPVQEADEEELAARDQLVVDEALEAEEELEQPLTGDSVVEIVALSSELASLDISTEQARMEEIAVALRELSRLEPAAPGDLLPNNSTAAGNLACTFGAQLTSLAGAYAGIAESYARTNWLNPGANYSFTCYLKTILMDARADSAAVHAAQAGSSFPHLISALSDIDEAQGWGYDAALYCGATVWTNSNYNSTKAVDFTQITRSMLTDAESMMGQCFPTPF